MNKVAAFAISLLLLLWGCKKEKEIIEDKPENTLSGVLVGNEGNFNWGNASLSYIDPVHKKIYNSVYKQNNGKLLGDVLQSIYIYGEDAFLVVNNSGKIIRIFLSNFKEKAVYSSFTSPRYMYIYKGKAFVSDLYAGRIFVFGVDGKPVENGTIKVNGWTEEMDADDNLLYVAGVNANRLYVIDMENEILVDSIVTDDAPSSVKIDKDGYVWVYCGDYQSENYVLEKINPGTKEVVTRLCMPANAGTYATKMAMNKDKDGIWFIYNGIKHLSVYDSTYDSFASAAYFETPYGIGVDFTGNVYVADAKNYTSEGEIFVFDKNRVLITTYKAGIIPGNFAFYDLYE